MPQDAHPEILTRVEKFKSFSYGRACLEERDDGPALVVQLRPRKNSRPRCSGCGRRGSSYEGLAERRSEFMPIWGIVVFLVYRMRRVNCKLCGVTVEMVSWCDGKHQLSMTYRWFLATWARRLRWSEVASTFRTSWHSVTRAVEHAVGRASRTGPQ